jgi:hypothetical protein
MNEVDLMHALEKPMHVDDMMRPLKASWLMTAHALNHTVMDVTDNRMARTLFQDGAFFTPLSMLMVTFWTVVLSRILNWHNLRCLTDAVFIRYLGMESYEYSTCFQPCHATVSR